MCPLCVLKLCFRANTPVVFHATQTLVVHPMVYDRAILAPNNQRDTWACFKTGLLGTRQLVKVAGKRWLCFTMGSYSRAGWNMEVG